MKGYQRILHVLVLGFSAMGPVTNSFAPNSLVSKHLSIPSNNDSLYKKEIFQLNSNADRLLDDFKTSQGEIIDPYRVLKISRRAGKGEVKSAYYALAKRYHPDKARLRPILPGKCNDLDQVREEWDRIKFAYEILTDKQKKARFDRNSVVKDPSAAMGRAAMDFVGWGLNGVVGGVFEVGKGLVDVGVDILMKEKQNNSTGTN